MKIKDYQDAIEFFRTNDFRAADGAWSEFYESEVQEPRIMDQAFIADDLEPGPLKDEMLKDFDPSQETYEEYLQRKSLGERPFNMAEGGQLVAPSVDGSRPGYAGKGYSWSEDRGAWRIFLKRGDEKIAGYVYPKDFGGSKKKAEQSVIKKLNKWKTDNPVMETRPVRSADAIDDYKLSNWLKKNKDFDFANSTVEDVMKKSKTNLSKSVVTKYLRNLGLTNPKFEPLPKEIQKEIKFKFANDYKGTWNFDTHKYGFSGTGGGDKQTRTYNNIRRFVNEPKAWRYGGAGLDTTEGWMVAQMDRAWRNGNKNYKPIYRTINNQKKIVGFIDNSEAGGGKKYISAIEFIKGSDADGILFTEHGDYANTKKFNDVARKVHGSPSKVITDILSEGGVEMFTETGKAKVQLKHVLNYLIDTKGLDKTIGGMVRHHRGGAYGSPTSDYQILNKVINSKISGIEGRIRADQILPEDIAKLKKWGASVTHKGKTYGGGPKTALGGLREIEKFILKGSKDVELYGKEIKGIEKWKKTDFNKFKTYLKQLCPKGKASGGRIGFAEGSATVACGRKALDKGLATGKWESPEKAKLAKKILQTAGKSGLAGKIGSRIAAELFGPIALASIPVFEAGIAGYDTVTAGTPFKEAVNKTLLHYMAGDKWKADSEKLKRKDILNMADGPEKEMLIKLWSNMGNLDRLSNLYDKQYNLEQDKNLYEAVDIGGYGDAGVSVADIDKQIEDVENKIQRAGGEETFYELSESVMDPSARGLAESKEGELDAIRKADSLWGSKPSPYYTSPTSSYTGEVKPERIEAMKERGPSYGMWSPAGEDYEKLSPEYIKLLNEYYKSKGTIPEDGDVRDYVYKDTGKSILEEEQIANKWKQLMSKPGMLGTQETFAGGGIASLKRK